MIGVQYFLFMGKLKHIMEKVAAVLVISGGIGNLIDRLFRGYVVDLFQFDFIDFAIFNFADVCVTVGAGIWMIYMVHNEIRLYRNQKSGSGEISPKQSGKTKP